MSPDPEKREERVRRISLLLQRLDYLDGRDSAHPEDYRKIAEAVVAELDE